MSPSVTPSKCAPSIFTRRRHDEHQPRAARRRWPGAIGANSARGQLDQVAEQAAAASWSYSHFLGRLLESELAARRQRVIDTCLHVSGLPWIRRISDFDFSFQPSIDRTLVEELATGRFMNEGRNVIFQGPPGFGRTHPAIALGLACSETGHRLLFLTALDLLRCMTLAFA